MTRHLTGVATVVGVLLAALAAAVVNAQVLGSDAPSPPGAAPVTAVASTTAPSSDTVADAPPPTVATATSSTPPASASVDYRVGDAGVVTLDGSGDDLVVLAATPAPGWTVVAVDDGVLDVRVVLRAGSQEAELRASLLFGVVSTAVSMRELGSTGSTPPTSRPVTSVRPPDTTDDTSPDDDDDSGSGGSDDGDGSDDDSSTTVDD